MSPLVIAGGTALIQAVLDTLNNNANGSVTDAQALAFFSEAASRYNAARAAWDAAGATGATGETPPAGGS